jgi:thioredoxin 1
MRIFIAFSFSIVMLACNTSSEQTPVSSSKPVERNLVVDGSQLNTLLAGDKPVLIDFNATWCGPCKTMKPIVKELAKKYEGKVYFVSLDTDKYPDVANQYAISSIPTFVLVQNGQNLWTSEGSLPKEMLEEPLKIFQ